MGPQPTGPLSMTTANTRTTRLTKTERALLEEATRNPRGSIYAMIWRSTSSQGGPHGTRSAMAVKALVAKGLADDLKVRSNHGANGDGWGTTHATEFSARITEAGRKALGA
jgi:hypothetical protein